jgi:hypothetical protein
LLTIACVLSGPDAKHPRTYTREHVFRLKCMVGQHLKQPHRFVCVDDSPLEGWWAKINLFEPGRFQGRVLYLDLDVTVTGDLDDLADHEGAFCIMRDPNIQLSFNSSVMAWDAGAADHLYLDFIPDHHIPQLRRGDQQWITEQKPEAHTFPRDWLVSYKRALRNNDWPDDMRVCVYHGRPKPWEAHDPIPDRFTNASRSIAG